MSSSSLHAAAGVAPIAPSPAAESPVRTGSAAGSPPAARAGSSAVSGTAGIDPRGPRFVAALTAVLTVVALLLGTGSAALVVLAVLAASFGLGVVRGVTGTWQSRLFRRFVRPRLAPPDELEDPRPPRFAQLVGLVISGLGVLLGLLGVGPAIPVAAALVLVASFLNAAFGLCLGCELYLLGVRLRAARANA